MKYVGFWFWWDDSDVWVTTERIWKQFFDVSIWWRRSESVNLCSAGELILLVLGRSRILKTLKLIQDSLQEQLIYYLVLIWDQRAHFFFFKPRPRNREEQKCESCSSDLWFVTRSSSLICFWWIYSSGSRSVLLPRAALVFPLIIWPRLFLWNGAASENTWSPSVSSSRVQLHKRPSETHYSQPSLQQQQINWTVQEIQLLLTSALPSSHYWLIYLLRT